MRSRPPCRMASMALSDDIGDDLTQFTGAREHRWQQAIGPRGLTADVCCGQARMVKNQHRLDDASERCLNGLVGFTIEAERLGGDLGDARQFLIGFAR